jgi:hypothetical protein
MFTVLVPLTPGPTHPMTTPPPPRSHPPLNLWRSHVAKRYCLGVRGNRTTTTPTRHPHPRFQALRGICTPPNLLRVLTSRIALPSTRAMKNRSPLFASYALTSYLCLCVPALSPFALLALVNAAK